MNRIKHTRNCMTISFCRLTLSVYLFLSCFLESKAIMDARTLDDLHARFGELCDMTIQVNERKFECHSFVFFTRSTYFEKICLDNKFSHISLDLSHLPGEAESFENILKFCYGQNPHLTLSNVYHLYSASRKLLFCKQRKYSPSNLAELCEEFMNNAIQRSWQVNMDILSSSFLETVSSPDDHALEFRTECISKLAAHALEIQNSKDESSDDVFHFVDHLVKVDKPLLYLILEALKVKGVSFVRAEAEAGAGDFDDGSRGLLLFEISSSLFDERIRCNSLVVLDFLISGLLTHVTVELHGCTVPVTKFKALRPYFLFLLNACLDKKLCSETWTKIQKLQRLFLDASTLENDLITLSPHSVQLLIPRSYADISESAHKLFHQKHVVPQTMTAKISLPVKVIDMIERYLTVIVKGTVRMESMQSIHGLANLVANFRDSHDILFDVLSTLHTSNPNISDDDASRLLGSVIDAEKLSESYLERALSSEFPLHHGLLNKLVLRQTKALKFLTEENELLKGKLDQKHMCCCKRKSCEVSASSEFGSIGDSVHKGKRVPIQMFTVFVKPPNGATMALSVNPKWRLSKLKKMICAKNLQLPSCWWLFYQRKLLDEQQLKIADFGIKKDCTLEIRFSISSLVSGGFFPS